MFLAHVCFAGRGLFSWVDEGKLREMEMKEGDSYVIEQGTVFHFYNIDEGQRLHVFSIHDTDLANSRSPSQTSQQQETALFRVSIIRVS
jgi:mannose-6-phosphate isomerase-like protein (cupin superfamily)